MKILQVSWEDAHSASGWTAECDLAKETAPCLCISVGLLVSEDAGGLVMAASINALGEHGDLWRIPKGMIRSRRVLGKVAPPVRA